MTATALTIFADLLHLRLVGSVFEIVDASGAFGSMLFSLLVGALLGINRNYRPVFTIAGFLHPIPFRSFWL